MLVQSIKIDIGPTRPTNKQSLSNEHSRQGLLGKPDTAANQLRKLRAINSEPLSERMCVGIFGTQAHAGFVIQPKTPALGLFGRYF